MKTTQPPVSRPPSAPPPYQFRQPQPPRPRRNLAIPVMLSAVVCAIILFVFIRMFAPAELKFHLLGKNGPTISIPTGAPRDTILLVMGVDYPNSRRPGADPFKGVRTDTMMLARINPRRKTVSIVSIPRDSKVYLADNRGTDKINAAHALGGADLAVRTVEQAFGIPIDNYVVVNFSGVRELVDTVGGIEVYVEKPMHYRDNTAKLFINFEPGYHKLNGKQAEGFLRFRHDQLGDIGRIRRQQQFIVAVAQKLKNPLTLTKLPQLVQVAQKYVHTDLSFNEMLGLAAMGKDVPQKNIRSATLPGTPGGHTVSYWLVDADDAQQVLDRLILNNISGKDVEPVSTEHPAKVGIYYDPAIAAALPEIISGLKQKNFEVVCQSRQRRASTQIIEHTQRVNDDLTGALMQTHPRFVNARLIFAPVGTTFENNACSMGEDYTLIIGADSGIPKAL